MFSIGEYVVCAGDGVGQVCDIVKKDISGNETAFYKVKIINNNLIVMIPTTSNTIRDLVNEDEIVEVFEMLENHDVELDTSTWNRRNREYLTKIKTGSVFEIADVLRALFLLKEKKSLSFGEKKLLDHCKTMISEEIALSDGSRISNVQDKIEACFN